MKTIVEQAEQAENRLQKIVSTISLAEHNERLLEKRAEKQCRTKGFVLKSTNNQLETIAVRIEDLKWKLKSACSDLICIGDDSQREYAESIRIAFSEYK